MKLDLDASSDDEQDVPRLKPSVRALAFDIFSREYSFELLGGVYEWLEELIEHFEIVDEANIRDTFIHLAIGCKTGKEAICINAARMTTDELNR